MEVNLEGSKKDWPSLSSDLPPEEISGACPPSCRGGCLSEAVMDPSLLGLHPAEQHHGARGCTNAKVAFSQPRSVSPEGGGTAWGVIQCGGAVFIASKVCFARANASHPSFSFPDRAAIHFSPLLLSRGWEKHAEIVLVAPCHPCCGSQHPPRCFLPLQRCSQHPCTCHWGKRDFS